MSQSNEIKPSSPLGASMLRKLFESWLESHKPTDEVLSKQVQATYGVDLVNASDDMRELVLYRMFLHDAKYWEAVA